MPDFGFLLLSAPEIGLRTEFGLRRGGHTLGVGKFGTKPAFMQALAVAQKNGRMAGEAEVRQLEDQITTALETHPDIVVQKARRVRNPDQMLGITARWNGMDSSDDEMVAALNQVFPVIGDAYIQSEPDYAEVLFVVSGPKFITGRVLLQV